MKIQTKPQAVTIIWLLLVSAFVGLSVAQAQEVQSSTRTFTLAFEPADSLQPLPLEPGTSRSVNLVFAMAPGDSLNEDESVGVRLAAGPGLTVSPSEFTFVDNSDSLRVVLSVNDDAPARAFELTVVAEVNQGARGARDERMPIDLPDSESLPTLTGEVRPSVDVVRTSALTDQQLRGFVRGRLEVARSATPEGPEDLRFIVVSGIGAKTIVDAAQLLTSRDPAVGVCVDKLDLSEESIRKASLKQEDCDLVQSLEEDSEIPLDPYGSVLYWVGIDADGKAATVKGEGEVVQLNSPTAVYVAPPVGFVTSSWAYYAEKDDDGVFLPAEVLLPLEIGGVTGGRMVVLTLERMVDNTTDSATVSFSRDNLDDLLRPLRANLRLPPVRTDKIIDVSQLKVVDGFDGKPGDYNASILDHKLYSLGNDRITLFPQDEPLPKAAKEGRDDGPFLKSKLKEIDLGVADVTVYHYSSENRAFEMLEQFGQVSSATEVSIDAVKGSVTIAVDPTSESTTTTLTYHPTTDTSIFEIVVVNADANTMRTVRLFGVDIFPPDFNPGETVGDILDGTGVETTLVHDGGIKAGPYFSAVGVAKPSAPVDVGLGLLPDLPGPAVGDGLDFIVNDPTLDGGLASVLMQLPDDLKTTGAFYYVYQREGAWDSFVAIKKNEDEIFSAPAPCPAASASRGEGGEYAWKPVSFDKGLRKDDRCVLVEIRDGGINDADRTANTFVYNTGFFTTFMEPVDDPRPPVGPGRHSSGAMDLVWLLGLVLIMLVGGQWHRRARGVRFHRR